MRWLYVLATLKQHLSKISTSIHETVEQDWGWVEKKNVAFKMNCVYNRRRNNLQDTHSNFSPIVLLPNSWKAFHIYIYIYMLPGFPDLIGKVLKINSKFS